MEKLIYSFGHKTEGGASMRNLLGGKGANLAEMARIGLPVPPGFTITTEVCTYYYKNNRTLPKGLTDDIVVAIKEIEAHQKKGFGDEKNPLLFSVRSGSRESMPGMMDTILNLGLNDKTVEGLAKKTGNARFAYDCYRRFIQMYGDVVMGVHAANEDDHDPFEEVLTDVKNKAKVAMDTDLSAKDLQSIVARYKALIKQHVQKDFPQCVYEQLYGAIGAVFSSWNNERAIIYRQKYHIPAEWGTAVNVQAMVFGNSGDNSATGVAFTRDPATGENVFYGEYLINAQGEDVVAGTRTPHPIAQLANEMPEAHKELVQVCQTLEKHFKDMQDFEFTVEDKQLYMLQTRNGKRTGLAAVRIAFEMVNEKLIDPKTAVKRIPADSIASLLVPIFDTKARKTAKVVAKGLPAGPGAASGKIVFNAKKAEELMAQGEKVILCRIETSPEDIRGMLASEGILTSRGGVSSHAALVARQMGKVCVCGAMDLVIDYKKKTISVGNITMHEGDTMSIDGTTGEIFNSKVATAPSEVDQVLSGTLKPEESYTFQLFNTVMQWADAHRKLGVKANADTPGQAKRALTLGAEGIGLCRTEHMFFEGDRIDYMRQMILADTEVARREALAKLLPFQREDFVGLLQTMDGLPVTIRLLDPPLHEFLPNDEASKGVLSKKFNIPLDKINDRISALHEQNPMLGHRGCRLGISYPEITEMQVTAIFEAVAQILKKNPKAKPCPEIMVPLVGFTSEFKHQAAIVHSVAKRVMEETKVHIHYTVGTMIEIPRAAVTADVIAEHAQFFSFGTNDLTQTTLGMSRDDMGSFFPRYVELEIVNQNPFATIDETGVGQLMDMATKRGRTTNPDLVIGICGEHGGDPKSIAFCQKIGITYVSCSPNRIPVARLAAAQAALA